jgi:tetratricopeptide (TPR) repeat protein
MNKKRDRSGETPHGHGARELSEDQGVPAGAGLPQVPPARQPQGGAARVLLVVVALSLILGSCLLAGCGSGLVKAARQAEAAGDLQGAVELYRQQLAEHPEDKDAVMGLAVDLFLLRDYDEALVYQERAVQLAPDDVQLKVELAFNYLNHQDQPQKAVEMLREATATERSADLLTFLAQAQLAAGQAQEAETSARSAIAEDRTYGWAYVFLVRLLEHQGRQAEAVSVKQAASAAGVDLGSFPLESPPPVH